MKYRNKFTEIGLLMIVFVSVSCNMGHRMSGEMNSKYLPMLHTHNGLAMPYQVFFPRGFDRDRSYPMLLFMHGAGERGDDNQAQLIHGSDLISKKMDELGGIAILPQCPSDDYWVTLKSSNSDDEGIRDFVIDVSGEGSKSLRAVQSLLQKYLDAGYVDKDRVYVSGLSMGGMATFDLLWRMPETFAAASPICGAGHEDKAAVMAHIPIRIYHGADDAVVHVRESLIMYDALIEVGGKVNKYIYPAVGHDSWTNAFAEPDFVDWMFAQSRGKR